MALVEVGKDAAGRTGALGKATTGTERDGRVAISALESRGSSLGRFSAEGGASLAPTGRVAYTADALAEFDAVAGAGAPGAEVDDRPVLQRLAERKLLDGVVVPATLFDLGVPEGYRDAVSRWPARVS